MREKWSLQKLACNHFIMNQRLLMIWNVFDSLRFAYVTLKCYFFSVVSIRNECFFWCVFCDMMGFGYGFLPLRQRKGRHEYWISQRKKMPIFRSYVSETMAVMALNKMKHLKMVFIALLNAKLQHFISSTIWWKYGRIRHYFMNGVGCANSSQGFSGCFFTIHVLFLCFSIVNRLFFFFTLLYLSFHSKW